MQRLPIAISEFSELREKNCVYVDKTKLAYCLVTEYTRTFLSRPRRFGKSLLVSTLEAILQGKKELFEGLWIANSDYSWMPYGIIRLDFSQLNTQSSEKLNLSLIDLLLEIALSQDIHIEKTTDVTIVFRHLIINLSKKYASRSIAILIDE